MIKEGILENRIFDRLRMRFFATLAWPNAFPNALINDSHDTT